MKHPVEFVFYFSGDSGTETQETLREATPADRWYPVDHRTPEGVLGERQYEHRGPQCHAIIRQSAEGSP